MPQTAATLTDDDRALLPAENEGQIFDFAEAAGIAARQLRDELAAAPTPA